MTGRWSHDTVVLPHLFLLVTEYTSRIFCFLILQDNMIFPPPSSFGFKLLALRSTLRCGKKTLKSNKVGWVEGEAVAATGVRLGGERDVWVALCTVFQQIYRLHKSKTATNFLHSVLDFSEVHYINDLFFA